jgi:hypothetical protein
LLCLGTDLLVEMIQPLNHCGGLIDKAGGFDHKFGRPLSRGISHFVHDRRLLGPGADVRLVTVIRTHRVKQLAGREYLPMAATIATWAVIVAAIGHADTARLLAAVTLVRSAQLLTKLSTTYVLKRRAEAPRRIRRQARHLAFNLQLAALAVALVLVALLAEGLKAIGQQQVAAFLPYVALGMPARYLRMVDVRAASAYSRLALGVGGLAMVLIGWGMGWHAAALGLAFGTREWIGYAVLRWWPRVPSPVKLQVAEPLHFEEVARYTAVSGRRLIAYRLTKALLTVLGPIGNAAARTGRGLNWHRKVEPYVPHHLGGFVLFTVASMTGAAILALRSGEPAAMVGAAGLLQIGCTVGNVVLVWRYLPARDSSYAVDQDDDDD